MVKQKKIFFLFLFGLFTISSLSTAQVKIAVLYSKLSEQHSTNDSQNIIEEITSWELLLMQNKIHYRVIYDDDLESGIEDEFDILILPSVKFVSKVERDELRNFLASGKSIISVGSKLFNTESIIENFQNLEQLFGLAKIENVSDEKISFLHSISPNHLNHFMTDDDPEIQITTSNEPLMCAEIENSNFALGYAILGSSLISNKSSIIYGTAGSGKYLWTGFALNDVVGGKNDLDQFKNLILNTLKWMDNDPDIYLIFPFGGGLRASLLTLEFNNALEPQLVEVLQKNNFSPNLIVNPRQKISKEVLRKFSDNQVILDLSGNSSDQYINPESVVNLITTFNLDNEIKINTVILNNSSDEVTDFEYLINIGIENILLNCEVTGRPKHNSENLFILPFSKTGINSKSYGPVKFIHYIPKNNCDKNSDDDFLALINQGEKEHFAFSSLKDIGEWWNTKNKLDAKIISKFENSIEVFVTNKNFMEVKNLQLHFNSNNINYRNISVSSNNILVEHYYQLGSGTIVVSLDKLLPNSTRKITIRFGEN